MQSDQSYYGPDRIQKRGSKRSVVGSIRNEECPACRVQELINRRSWGELPKGDTRIGGDQHSRPSPAQDFYENGHDFSSSNTRANKD
jgi:hypothetical protein